MSEADKMFEELGYKKIEKLANGYLIITYINRFKEKIIFDSKHRRIAAETENGFALSLNLLELQAINKKVEELKWMK